MENEVRQDDARLWVRLEGDWSEHGVGPSPRWTITGSSHTHRGHFNVWVPEIELRIAASLAQVVEASEEAKFWLDGFLAGQEPDLDEFLGSDEELGAHADEGDERRYEAWRAHFRRTGWAPGPGHLPSVPPGGLEVGPPQPWCWVGGLFRVLDGTRWRPAEPQPPLEVGEPAFWPGTPCAERRHHRLMVLDSGLLLCEDCHELSGEVDADV